MAGAGPHQIRWQEVEKAELRTFSALAEYGGWGIRYNFFYQSKGFIARSGTGLFLKLKDGRKRMFSISKPGELKEWIPEQRLVYE